MNGKRTWLVPLWAGLLLLGGPVLSGADPAGDDLLVTYERGLVSLRASDVPLDFIVREIAARADLQLIQYVALDRHVSADFDAEPLADVLSELLSDSSYQLYMASHPTAESAERKPIPGGLWIFAEGSAVAPAATAYLEIALFEGDFIEKKEAIRELRRLGTPQAVQVLSLALSDEHRAIRRLALEALSEIGGDDALAAIASAAADADPLTRGRAAEAVATVGGRSAAALLELALHDADPLVRAAAIESMVELDDGQSRLLIRKALQDPDPGVRARAVDVLENLEDEAMFDVLYPFE